jgi:cobalamin synthase
MDFPYNQDYNDEREDFLNKWYQQEKSSERMGAILMIFASVLILVFERLSVDSLEYKTMALAASVALLAGGITLLMRSRRPSEERRALHFLRAENQNRNAGYAGVAAAFLLYQAGGRPLMLIGGGLLVIFALWLQWRSMKIRQFDALFAHKIDDKAADE